MEKSKAYTPEKPYMCVYETKEDGIGYATFDNKEALMELVQECKFYGDKIIESCKIESKIDITQPTENKFITKDMVEKINEYLTNIRSPFGYRYDEKTHGMLVVLHNHFPCGFKMIKNYNIQLTDEYYHWLRTWFQENYHMDISYNERGTVWSIYVEMENVEE